MRMLIVVVTGFLLLWTALLALPVVTAAQRRRPFPTSPKKRDYFVLISLLFGLSSTVAAQSVVVSVPGTAQWTNTGLDVVKGDLLTITATGSWTEGGTTNGPDGIEKPWPDNFFNFADLGACMYCAKTATPFWGALIGYIGSSPPAAGSYTSPAVFPEVTEIFLVGKSYKASAPASGRLWLNKNTDAYSNYTVDNGGQVQVTITASSPETETQYHARMRKSAASIKALEPFQRARNYCVRAALDHWKSEIVKKLFKFELCKGEPDCIEMADILLFAGEAVGDTVQIRAEFDNGRTMNATWDFGRLVFKELGMFPGAEGKLFGLFGEPALDCTMAGFWLTGELGGQLGQLLREKFLLPNASIAGAWTLKRESPLDCINFKSCHSTPIPLLVDHCTDTVCNISRSDGGWQYVHTITRSGDRWSANFEDIGVDCTDVQNITHPNVARISISFSVTTADAPGKVAKSVGGYYTVQADSNPPDCPDDAYARYLLHGSR